MVLYFSKLASNTFEEDQNRNQFSGSLQFGGENENGDEIEIEIELPSWGKNEDESHVVDKNCQLNSSPTSVKPGSHLNVSVKLLLDVLAKLIS